MSDVQAAPPRGARRPWVAHYPPGVSPEIEVPEGTVAEVFRRSVEAFGERPVIAYRGPDITYAELGRRAWQVANALKREGFGPGDTLALYLPNTPYHPFFFYGALAVGGRIAHLSPLDAARVLTHKLEDLGARTLVTLNLPDMAKMAMHLLDHGAVDRVILCDEAAFGPFPIPLAEMPDRGDVVPFDRFVEGAGFEIPDMPSRPDDVALLQYTGGTTGLPKGAMLTHRNILAASASFAGWTAEDASVGPDAVTLCVLPLFHIYALCVILLRLTQIGGKLVMRMRFDPGQALKDIETQRVTYFPGVPTMWIALANHPDIEKTDLSSLQNCGSGGAPLPVEVGKRFEKITGRALLGGWGMTETCAAGTAVPQGAQHTKAGTIGVPLPGIELRVVSQDEPTREVPAGEIGEIAVRGANVTGGYWNRSDATADSYAEGWFLTGDMGRMDEDGFFFLVDRKSDMILSGGFNVYPQMVEQAVYEHPDVAECLVIGIPDEYRGESAKVFVTLREGAGEFSLEALQDFLRDRLGKHEMPRALEFRPVLPRTPVGKLSRKELKDEAAAARA